MQQEEKKHAEDLFEEDSDINKGLEAIKVSLEQVSFIIRELEMEYIIKKPFSEKFKDSLFGNK